MVRRSRFLAVFLALAAGMVLVALPLPSSAAADPLLNRDVTFFSVAQGTYVSTELSYPEGDTGMLRARATAVGPWEKYRIVPGGAAGVYAIWSYAASRYVTAELGHPGNRAGELRARSTVIGPWEKFAIEVSGDGSLALLNIANYKWVSAELSESGIYKGMLRARGDTVGPWEKFRIDGPPKHTDGLTKPVYLIHGFSPIPQVGGPFNPAENCASTWANVRNDFANGATGPRVTGIIHTVGFYTQDSNCDRRLVDGTRDTNLLELGKRMANEIYSFYSQYGQPVDVVAHSMGGLIIREALAGVAAHKTGFPPVLYVEDVVTLGTPHKGSTMAGFCGSLGYQQCKDMTPNSAFLKQLPENPQSVMGTDWTIMGADDDETAPANSAVGVLAQHKVRYPKPQPPGTPGIEHGSFRTLDGSNGYIFKLRWCGNPACGNLSSPDPLGGETTAATESPIYVARLALYYSTAR